LIGGDTNIQTLFTKGDFKKGMKLEIDIRKTLIYSIVFHIVVLMLFFFVDVQQPKPKQKVVTIKLNKRPIPEFVKKERERERLAKVAKRQADSSIFKKDSADNSAIRKVEKSLLTADPNQPNIKDKNRVKDNDTTYSRLSQSLSSKFGRLKRDDSSFSQDYTGKKSLNKDNKDKQGGSFDLGRDDVDKTVGKKGIGGTESNLLGKTPVAKKGSLSGRVTMKSRRVTYRPNISLPTKYSKMGTTFTIEFKISVTPEGLVTKATLVRSVGYPDLERRMKQYARRYRFEEALGGGVQVGKITFYIRPR